MSVIKFPQRNLAPESNNWARTIEKVTQDISQKLTEYQQATDRAIAGVTQGFEGVVKVEDHLAGIKQNINEIDGSLSSVQAEIGSTIVSAESANQWETEPPTADDVPDNPNSVWYVIDPETQEILEVWTYEPPEPIEEEEGELPDVGELEDENEPVNYWVKQKWGMSALPEELVETSALVEAHEHRLEATEQLVSDTKAQLDATDLIVGGLGSEITSMKVDIQGNADAAGSALHVATLATELAEGLVSFDAEPPADPPLGQIWMPLNEDGQVTGMWRWSGSEWATYTLLTGLLVVPTEDGGQTIIGPDGVEATQIVAEILRTDVLYADVAGVKTLVITDIPRQNLAEDVGDALATAETLGSRILIDGAAGTLTIARNRPQPSDPLTAMILGATSLDMVVADKSVAYIDSELEQMSIPNVLVRDTLQVGAHQVRTLPGTGITIFQQVAEA